MYQSVKNACRCLLEKHLIQKLFLNTFLSAMNKILTSTVKKFDVSPSNLNFKLGDSPVVGVPCEDGIQFLCAGIASSET